MLKYEVCCYALLALTAALGAFQRRGIISAIALAAFVLYTTQ